MQLIPIPFISGFSLLAYAWLYDSYPASRHRIDAVIWIIERSSLYSDSRHAISSTGVILSIDLPMQTRWDRYSCLRTTLGTRHIGKYLYRTSRVIEFVELSVRTATWHLDGWDGTFDLMFIEYLSWTCMNIMTVATHWSLQFCFQFHVISSDSNHLNSKYSLSSSWQSGYRAIVALWSG